MYDIAWYIGRVIEQNQNNMYLIKSYCLVFKVTIQKLFILNSATIIA